MDGFDLLKDAAVNLDQSPQGRPAVGADQFLQPHPFPVKSPRTIGFESHKPHECGACRMSSDIGIRTPKAIEICLRQIDTAHCKVFGNVPQNVGELKSDPE